MIYVAGSYEVVLISQRFVFKWYNPGHIYIYRHFFCVTAKTTLDGGLQNMLIMFLTFSQNKT